MHGTHSLSKAVIKDIVTGRDLDGIAQQSRYLLQICFANIDEEGRNRMPEQMGRHPHAHVESPVRQDFTIAGLVYPSE